MLGVQYRDDGVAQGERVIRALCRHPSTAQFAATKLVRHFVADNPPPTAVARISRVFRETAGDLRAVSRALVELPEAWDADTKKFRPPQEWLIAVLRALDIETAGERATGICGSCASRSGRLRRQRVSATRHRSGLTPIHS